MKSKRQNKILDIITKKAVTTQEELAEELRKAGFDVTQATVSRDIKEMRLIKVPTTDNTYRYAPPQESRVYQPDRIKRIFQDGIVKVDFSENIIVIKTLPGAAQAVASAIDNIEWPEIIGTVAGDDTILVVIKSKKAVNKTLKKFNDMLL